VPGTDLAARETLANLQPPREVPGTDFPLAPISLGRLLAFGDPCRSAWHRFGVLSECLAPNGSTE